MASYTRQRGQSNYEESNLDAFVKTTVEWQPNVSFAHSADGSGLTLEALATGAKAVLIVGQESVLKTHPVVTANAALASTLNICGAGKTASTFVGATRVVLGVVPEKASRTNSAGRPDVLPGFVKAAAGECGKDAAGAVVAVLALVSSADDAAAYASHFARGSLSPFTAKSGAAEVDYTARKAPIQLKVTFQGPVEAFNADKYVIIAKYVQVAMRLVEAPTNVVDTTTFAEIAHKMGAAVGGGSVTVSQIQGEDLREQGYGGIYGVGKAAEFAPNLVTLHYKPATKTADSKKIGMVGKGLVYDCGGLSIKTPTPFMCGMKRDMGGAGGVFGGFLAAVAMQSHHEITATLCLADNAIGPRSFRNDDILRLKSGKTVEINNTDAEGRLVLADGVYHTAALIPNFSPPDCVVNMATLTGAQLIGVGKKHAGLYCNSDEWEQKSVAAGKASGDPVFPIVYAPEYHEPEFASKIADMKNLMAATNNAGISCAGYFIEANLPEDYKGGFAHFDIAGPSADTDGATGFGVALLANFLTK